MDLQIFIPATGILHYRVDEQRGKESLYDSLEMSCKKPSRKAYTRVIIEEGTSQDCSSTNGKAQAFQKNIQLSLLFSLKILFPLTSTVSVTSWRDSTSVWSSLLLSFSFTSNFNYWIGTSKISSNYEYCWYDYEYCWYDPLPCWALCSSLELLISSHFLRLLRAKENVNIETIIF